MGPEGCGLLSVDAALAKKRPPEYMGKNGSLEN